MDKKLEQQLARKIADKLESLLKKEGFRKTKSTFYTRMALDRIEFVHLNKLASGPYFRVQVGIRFLCDPFPVVALEGISSDDQPAYRIRLAYTREQESLDRCAEAILEYVQEQGLPWLERWSSQEALIVQEDSPVARFREEYKSYVTDSVEGFEQSAALSRRLLGIPEETHS
ncbi:hypothetical protein B9G55_06430 [Saccharibacillus sp. O16]|nr:hypothetical protein B9G55_06430 [Saccharibacillus sp. O16]